MNINRMILTALAVGALGASAQAAIVAMDSAADGVYTGGNIHGLNGGFGFGPWTANPSMNGGTGGNFQFTSSQNGNGSSGNIDSSGRSWGAYANSGNTTTISRAITASLGTPMTVWMDFDNGWIDNGSEVYASIGSYQFGFTGGQSDYWYDLGTGRQSSGLGFTADGLRLKLVLNATGGYNFSATNLASNSVWASAQLFTGGNIPTFLSLTNVNAGGGSSNNAYINNMKVEAVPEPTTMLALGLGLSAIARRRKTK